MDLCPGSGSFLDPHSPLAYLQFWRGSVIQSICMHLVPSARRSRSGGDPPSVCPGWGDGCIHGMQTRNQGVSNRDGEEAVAGPRMGRSGGPGGGLPEHRWSGKVLGTSSSPERSPLLEGGMGHVVQNPKGTKSWGGDVEKSGPTRTAGGDGKAGGHHGKWPGGSSRGETVTIQPGNSIPGRLVERNGKHVPTKLSSPGNGNNPNAHQWMMDPHTRVHPTRRNITQP